MNLEEFILGVQFKAQQNKKTIPTAENIQTEIEKIDETKKIQEWRNRIKIKKWDGISDINTASIQYIKESNPWLDCAYFILIDDEIIYFQTHDPFQSGWIPITNEKLQDTSNKHAIDIATLRAQNEIFEIVCGILDVNLS